MRLQYQLSNGSWVNCGDRTAEFLSLCVQFGGFADEPAVRAALAAGTEIRNGANDWYRVCRDGDVADAALAAADARRAATAKRPVLYCRSCGQTGSAGAYPFSTLPGSGRCDDCC